MYYETGKNSQKYIAKNHICIYNTNCKKLQYIINREERKNERKDNSSNFR